MNQQEGFRYGLIWFVLLATIAYVAMLMLTSGGTS